MRTLVKAYTLSECMDAMTEYVESFERLGKKNVIFCEDRLTLIAERALTRRLGGSLHSSVTTFARFLKTDERVLSKQGSVMAIGSIMAKLQEEGKLQCFKTSFGVANNAKYIYETIAQFAASEVTPQTLDESISLLPDDMLRRKLFDLRLIYEEYEKLLVEKRYIDESKYLSLLPDCIRADKSLKDANVFFLCYSSFTAQAAQAIRAINQTAKNVIGIFCDGEEEIYTHHASKTFCRVCEEFEKVTIRNFGVALDGEAETLRVGLYEPERLADGSKKAPTDKIRLFEGEDLRTETEYIAVQISKKMRENPKLRYRDFAVLVPSVADYSLPLKKTFEEYGIPCFFDEKKSLKSHPLSAFLIACLEAARDGYSPSSVHTVAQNYFFGESDEYRNYLLKYANHRGGVTKELRPKDQLTGYDYAYLEGCRERFLTISTAFKGVSTGKSYCDAIRKILSEFDVEKKLNKLTEEVQDIALQSFLGQIFNALEKVLLEAEYLLAKTNLSIAEFSAIFSEGLSATELSLIPLKSDAVFVGDVTSGRIEKVGVLFVAGLTDSVPSCSDDTALISDKEIERLAAVKTMLEPTVAQVNLRHRENVCLNLCTFIDELHLSYPLGAGGEMPSVSEILRYVHGIFVGKDGKELRVKKAFTEEEFPYACSSKAPAVRRMIAERAAFENRQTNKHVKYDSLFEALRLLGVSVSPEEYEKRKFVSIDRAEELFFSGGRISPTMLERYFACPFANFTEKGLKLKEREESAVVAVDSGNFIHELLERTTKKLSSLETEEQAESLAREEGEKLLQDPIFAAQSDTARGAYASERLMKEGVAVVRAVYRQLKKSEYNVEGMEVPVSTEEFHGKIDRVDATDKYVRVIDYKTGKISASPEEYYTGKKLQLPLYISAIAGDRTPAGIFYFPASYDFKSDGEGRYRMVGYMNGDKDALLKGDKTLTDQEKSEFFDADLSEKKTKWMLPEEDFRDFIEYASYVAKQAKSELKSGYVEPTPYEGACKYCEYGGICGFNTCKEKPRKVGEVQVEEIVNTVRECKGED